MPNTIEHPSRPSPTFTQILSLLFLLPTLYASELHALENRIDPEAIIKAHNNWRAEVGVSGLAWSGSLADKAIKWANELKDNENCLMVHSGPGENLYWASALKTSHARDKDGNWIWNRSTQKITEKQVVDSWAGEKEWYDHKSNSCDAPEGNSCGHYTQVIWESSTEVGCGKAVCPDSSQVWVCNYSPAGNIVGRRPY
ncbi:MAG: SCP-like extracellular [Proteobacteria bacterium]|nr:SCP-like extracellular [Pseudomonadota bacterium]MBU1738316.1 SCP-like extracellular [Pseudomonadota bacterium]